MPASESEIEEMIADCKKAIESDCDDFTEWERGFISDVEERNYTGHLSERQIEKLEQIWEKRVVW